jgi:hypothetical protein
VYIQAPGLVLGFHGCDQQVVDDIVNQKTDFKESTNSYDWLGHGMYFWEGNYDRALSFAEEVRDNPRANGPVIKKAAVLGAVVDLKNCLNLSDEAHLKLVQIAYESFRLAVPDDSKLPKNRKGKGTEDLLARDLDCAVINYLHTIATDSPFDSVKSPFIEGDPLYTSAGFNTKNHIQICIRNPNCVLGFFIPRKHDDKWP